MSRLTKNVIYNVAGQGAVLLLSLVAVRFIFRRLGDDVFGVIYFNLALTALLTSALELGVSSTTVREVSSHYDSDPSYIKELIRTASLFYWTIGLFLLAVIWVAAPFLVEHWINLKAIDAAAATSMIRILSPVAAVALPKVLYTSLFRGRQLMGANNLIDVITALAQQAGIVLILVIGGSVYQVVAWISASAVAGICAYVLVSGRLFGWSALLPFLVPSVVRRNLGFTGQMTLISVLSLVQVQADKVVVSKLLPIAEFGFYGFASTIVSRAAFVTTAVSQAAFPAFSKLFGSGDQPALFRQYRKLHDLLCYGTLPLFAMICFAALPLYSYIFNPAIAQRLLLPTAFLALGSWMNATLNMPYMLSLAMGKPQIGVRLNLYALVAVLPVTVALIYRFGLPGAGFSWVFFHLFAYAYFIPRILRECMQTDPWSWHLHALKVLLLGALVYGPAWLLVGAAGSYSALPLAVAYIAASVAFAVGAYLLIGTDLRETLQRLPRLLAISKADALFTSRSLDTQGEFVQVPNVLVLPISVFGSEVMPALRADARPVYGPGRWRTNGLCFATPAR